MAFEEPQWAVVGDTFPVGCIWSDNIVYRSETFHDNPDGNNPEYNTKFGMYNEKCGIESLMMSWGHDVSKTNLTSIVYCNHSKELLTEIPTSYVLLRTASCVARSTLRTNIKVVVMHAFYNELHAVTLES